MALRAVTRSAAALAFAGVRIRELGLVWGPASAEAPVLTTWLIDALRATDNLGVIADGQ